VINHFSSASEKESEANVILNYNKLQRENFFAEVINFVARFKTS
jgi:hypothetical protein